MNSIPREEFNVKDPKNLGRPIYFNVEKYAEAVEMMIRADELQIALDMIKNVPGWYRDNPPERLTQIKEKIYQNTYDQIRYATDDEEANCTKEFGQAQWTNGYMSPRAEIISDIMTNLNKNNIIPWIYDLGCSHGNLPLGLKQAGFDFKYKGSGMNYRIVQKVKSWMEDVWMEEPEPERLKILYCTEVLEHMFNSQDLVHSAHKMGVNYNYIILSTPMYTLGGGLPDWDTRQMGHVRTWTPREFSEFAFDNFPGYQWELCESHSMVLIGRR